MFRIRIEFFVFVVMWLWLAGCAQSASQPVATPPDTPTQIKATAPTVNSDEKETATPATTAEPLLTGTPALDSETFPDLAQLRWKTQEQDGNVIRLLAGFTLPLRLVGVSPRGDWLAVSVQAEGGDTSPANNKILMIDTQDDAHWWWDGVGAPYWLPDGRLIKVDMSGGVLVGANNAWDDLQAPQPMEYLHFVVNGIGFFDAETTSQGLWRVDLATKSWEMVQSDIANVPLTLAQDRSSAVAFAADKLWRVPVAMGTAADSTELEYADVLGSGGASPPPINLAGSSYWLRRQVAELSNLGFQVNGEPTYRFGLLYDADNGRLVDLEDLPVIVPELYNFGLWYDAPPDGEWLAITLLSIASSPSSLSNGQNAAPEDDLSASQSPEDEAAEITAQALYVAPGDDLTAGHLLESVEFASWLSDPLALIVRDVVTQSLLLYHLPITEDSQAVDLQSSGVVVAASLVTNAPVVPEPGMGLRFCWFCTVAYAVPQAVILHDRETAVLSVAYLTGDGVANLAVLEGGSQVLATVGTSIITTSASNPSQVLRFDRQGSLIDSLVLPSGYEAVDYAVAAPDINSVFLVVGSENAFAIIEWQFD